ncbi:MAG: hypothetical protein AAF449_24430 [Myxococcota bacterium]
MIIAISTPNGLLPTNREEYETFHGPVLRLRGDTGHCLLAGKVFAETDRQYRVIDEIDGIILIKRYLKTPRVHFDRCKYCPPDHY